MYVMTIAHRRLKVKVMGQANAVGLTSIEVSLFSSYTLGDGANEVNG